MQANLAEFFNQSKDELEVQGVDSSMVMFLFGKVKREIKFVSN